MSQESCADASPMRGALPPGGCTVVEAPERNAVNDAHVTVTNDGITYTAGPLVTSGGSGTYLTYTAVESRPSGEWVLGHNELPAQGGGEISVYLEGQFVDGRPEGTTFMEGNSLYCAFGPSTRRQFSHFSPVYFTSMGPESTQYEDATTVDSTQNDDRVLTVGITSGDADPSVGPAYEAWVNPDYETHVSTNMTYEVVVTKDTSKFKWRKYAAGMNPQGEAKLEDVTVTLPGGNPQDVDSVTGITTVGIYTNSFDYTYELRIPTGFTSYFQWRKYPKGETSASASDWSANYLIPTTEASAQAIDSGLSLYFNSETFTTQTEWGFTVTAEGSGRGVFSDPIAISTNPVELDLGVTVRFSTTGGKGQLDRWVFDALTHKPNVVPATWVSNRHISCPVPAYDPGLWDTDEALYGIQHELKISNRGNNSFTDPCFTAAGDGRTVCGATITHADFDTRGPPHESSLEGFTENMKLFVDGYYSGAQEQKYHVEVTSASPLKFKWRKSSVGNDAVGTLWSGDITVAEADTSQNLAHMQGGYSGVTDGTRSLPYQQYAEKDQDGFIELELGVKVKFATKTGKSVGDKWSFIAKTFWSTPYSDVVFTDALPKVNGDDGLVELRGVYTGDASRTYEVVIQVDSSMFKYRSFPYGGAAAGAFSDAMSVSTSWVNLDRNIQLRFKSAGGKSDGDKFTFHAYKGHVVTYMARPYMQAIPDTNNGYTEGDPRVPTISGLYLGHEDVVFVLKVDGSCTTSCTQFRWKKLIRSDHYDGRQESRESRQWSDLIDMTSGLHDLADGVKVQWGMTSGYKHGNSYYFNVRPMPSSILPAVSGWSEDPILSSHKIEVSGTYVEATAAARVGGASSEDTLITLEFSSSSIFRWRKNTGEFSTTHTVSTDSPFSVSDGLNVTFTQGSGYTRGKKYLIPMKSHLPKVANVTTAHTGGRSFPRVSSPVANVGNYQNTNHGSLIGDVLPMNANVGWHTITAVPTPGHVENGRYGLSNVINSVPTSGYVSNHYPDVNIEIVGEPVFTPVLSAMPNIVHVTGTYSGSSSYVYEVVATGASTVKWRRYAKGSSAAENTFSSDSSITSLNSNSNTLSLDQGVEVYFTTSGTSLDTGMKWTFSAEKGHSFRFREVGRSTWSSSIEITDGPQALVGGVSLQFSSLSGYSPGDQFLVKNRTVDSYGVYAGDSDTTYEIEIFETISAEVTHPILDRAPGSQTTGLASNLKVSGTYSGKVTYFYEVEIADASGDSSTFKWRKYLEGAKAGAGPFHAAQDVTLNSQPQELDDGIEVSWGAVTGHTAGDKWTFSVRKGDTFKWKKVDAAGEIKETSASTGVKISGVGRIRAEGERGNLIESFGSYTGAADATYVIEMLDKGTVAFRWRKAPLGVPANEVLVDEGWSQTVNVVVGQAQLLSDGVYVNFKSESLVRGDIFYVDAKATSAHHLSNGVYINFGATSGYALGDKWSFNATAPILARGPLQGGTELLVSGSGFLDSDNLKCRLYDDRTLKQQILKGKYISPTLMTCVTEKHMPDTLMDPVFTGVGESRIDVRGLYTADQDTTFTLEIKAKHGSGSDTKLEFLITTTDSEGRPNESNYWANNLSGNLTRMYNVATTANGVSFKFPGLISDYAAGDKWTVQARAYSESEHPFIGYETIRPGVSKQVQVSNDGMHFSEFPSESTTPGFSKFLFSDVYVSVSGNDAVGDGTFSEPYRTIQQAVKASLQSTDSSENKDTIVVLDGRYTGVGNNGLHPMGKTLTLRAANFGESVIDCSDSDSPELLANGDRHGPALSTGSFMIKGINTEGCYNRR